jgi:hypothetical protein
MSGQTVTSPISKNPTALQNPTVYFIFQGTSWTTTNAGALASDAQTIIQSPYLSKLTDYGSTGTAVYGGYTIDNTAAPTPDSDPTKQQGQFITAAKNEIQSKVPQMSSWAKPQSSSAVDSPVYVVVFDTGLTDSNGNPNGVFGANTPEDYGSNLTMNEIFIGDWGGDQDGFTNTFSHEIVERIFSGTTKGLEMNASADASTDGEFQHAQVSDNEPDHANYTYRLDGNLQVQAYWSLSAPNTNGLNGGFGAFVVPDGNQQNVWLDPQWTYTGTDSLGLPQYSYTRKNVLDIFGDQLGANYNDTITLGTTPNGGVLVTLNGETVAFDPGVIATVFVGTGGGSNTINVLATPAHTSTSIQDQGNDTVVIGQSNGAEGRGKGYLGNIQGSVTVAANNFGEPGSAVLSVDDSGDSSPQTVTMKNSEIQYEGDAPIYYNPSSSSGGGVTELFVYGGSGGNTYNVQNTSTLSNGNWLNTGTGNDTVNVYGTSGWLEVNNPGGDDTLNVGVGNTGSLDGSVDAYGAGSTHLYINDSNDTASQTVTMNDRSLFGLGSGGVHWAPTSSAAGGVTYVEVDGGSGNNTYNVNNTSNLYNYTYLLTGGGTDTINVLATQGSATTGGLHIFNSGSDVANRIYVGLGSVANINGTVSVQGYGVPNIVVDDHIDSTARTVTLSGGSLTGLGNAGAIDYGAEFLIGTTSLTIDGPSKGSTYNIEGTPRFTATTVNGGAGNGVFNVGSGGSLSNIYGALTIDGGGGGGVNTLNANDSSSASGQTYTLSSTQLAGSDFATITYAWLATIHATGSGNDTLTLLTPVPTVATGFNGGSGTNTLQGANVGNTWTISGANSGRLDNVFFSNFQKLVGGNTSDTFKFTTSTASEASIDGGAGGGTNKLDYSSLGSSFPVAVNLATGSAPLLSGGFSNINAVAGSTDTANTLTAANTTNQWTISGNDTGSVNSFAFSGMGHLVGGTGVDSFRFSSTSGTVLSINGGGAPAGQGDWLDYSAFPSSSTVTVNLATGSATNVNGGAAGAVSNIQNVIGSVSGTNNLTGDAQGNILIGGSGANTLTGGSGGSLLVGGSGHGTITGGASTDVLIAGSTTFNAATTAGEAALMAVLAELQSADTFAQKVSDIINGNSSGGGSDLNGSNKLTWGVSGATVKASTGTFTLSGDASGSSAADWFFANSCSTVKDFNDDGVLDEHNNNAIGVF